MTDNLANLETAVEGFLARVENPTPEQIRELIGQFRVIPTCQIDDESAERLARTFEARHWVTMTIGSALTSNDYTPWLDSARAQINPYYWDRYRKLLSEKHMSSQVIATLDSVSDRVLGFLENPAKEGEWDRRGMVVGHVQSGKTAHYTALICKAADAGYKLIVVIAGIHNTLRNQTQVRIDEGFVGRDSARLLANHAERFIGVGRYDKSRRPITFTNSLRDFNKAMATGVGIPLQNLSEPAVFVIKKNSSTLRNLLEWLREHSAHAGGTVDAPMLLVDDEADNASINVSQGPGEVSRINGQIRELLQMFDRSCYVGYTATPFANIFIDPETDNEMLGHDLFPKHFIVSLDPPSNYFGATRVFLDEPEKFIRYIEDHEDWLPLKHSKESGVSALAPSLVTALRTFVVARAVKLVRHQEHDHNSMLVNVSRFTNVQRQLRNEIHNWLQQMQASIRVNGALPSDRALKDPELAALFHIWEDEFSRAGETWEDIKSQFVEAAAPIRAVEVNSNSAGTLNYAEYERTGLNVIAVGGLSLSRGLTLEGLTVSYFLRNSMMYDTLMQMGRWFGYRPDYEDLVRIWMTEEAEGWYAHITESIEMLRAELRSMEAAGATPEEFGLKVRSHPDTLIVTARNKMGSGQRVVVSIGLGNSFIETALLKRDVESVQRNKSATVQLSQDLASAGAPTSTAVRVPGGWLLSSVPVEPVLTYLASFQNHAGSMLTDRAPVRRYISDRQSSELAIWDILFASIDGRLSGAADTIADNTLGIPIFCQRRTAGSRSDSSSLHITNKQRVASRGVEKTGLTEHEITTAEASYREGLEAEGKWTPDQKEPNYPDFIYRRKRTKPLLIIHLLKIEPGDHGKSYGNETVEPVVSYSISFPRTGAEEKRVEYVVNTTWLRENFPQDLDPDEMYGDVD